LLDSIGRFVKEFKKKYDRLDVLVNKVRVMFNKLEVMPEGFERTPFYQLFGAEENNYL
jgi:hypothetical protein